MIRHVPTAAILPLFLTACGSGSDAGVDVVRNSDEPLWTPEEAWTVVEQAVAAPDEADAGRIFDLFNAEGRFLGTLRLPFALRWSIPEPIVREGVLYGVTSDEAGVPYVVRGRVVKSG